jgi:hypothetical protein
MTGLRPPSSPWVKIHGPKVVSNKRDDLAGESESGIIESFTKLMILIAQLLFWTLETDEISRVNFDSSIGIRALQ